MFERERFPIDKVHTIRNGVDTQRFQPLANQQERTEIRRGLGIPEDAPVGVIIAALRPEKNHEMFVSVAARVREAVPNAHFLIVGDGPCRRDIESAVQQAGANAFIHLLGNRSDTEAILGASDAFRLCSHNEASPVSILEALASGIPVVSTNVGSVHETVRVGETGFLVEPGDTNAMAQFIVGLFQDASLAKRLGAEGRRIVEETGSLDSMVTGYTELIEETYDRTLYERSMQRRRSVYPVALGSRAIKT